MQAYVPVSKQKRSVLPRPAFIIHLSILGGFVSIVGYLAVFGCHHIH